MVDTRIRFNVQLIREDMADRGWNGTALARACGLSPMTISYFLSGFRQTNPTAKKIADAFGKTVKRYRLPSASRGVAA